MYSCPGCGANLRFDIREQKMKCSYCDSLYEVEELSEDNAYNDSQFESNVFVCSQCGGAIYSQENDLTGVCSYCGSHTAYKSRIDKVDRPKWILPFTIEKDKCKREYTRLIRRAFYAPKELKDPELIDGIRGVYMPYWVHDYSYDKHVMLKARKGKAEVKGDYIYSHHSELKFDLDADYMTLRQDASKGFSNELAQQLKPYNMAKIKDFSPAYLCGFYGETADLDRKQAGGDTWEMKNGEERVKDFVQMKFPHHDLTYMGSQFSKVTGEENKLALMPVWFLSYRNGKRVSYSAVNGQTGELISEIPISLPKFAACSAVLGVILFLLFNLFLVMKPEYVAMIAAATASLTLYLCKIDLNMLTRKECGSATNPREDGRGAINRAIVLAVILGAMIALDSFGKLSGASFMCTRLIPCVVCLVSTVRGVINLYGISKDAKVRRWRGYKVFPGFLFAFIAIIASTAVEFVHPVSDMAYWGVGLGSMGLVVLSLLCVILYHNLMSSRRLPQFDHMGGDDSVKK